MPYLAIIGNTANIIEENKKAYKDFDEIFTKPFSRKQILDLIDKVYPLRDKFSPNEPPSVIGKSGFSHNTKSKKASNSNKSEKINTSIHVSHDGDLDVDVKMGGCGNMNKKSQFKSHSKVGRRSNTHDTHKESGDHYNYSLMRKLN